MVNVNYPIINNLDYYFTTNEYTKHYNNECSKFEKEMFTDEYYIHRLYIKTYFDKSDSTFQVKCFVVRSKNENAYTNKKSVIVKIQTLLFKSAARSTTELLLTNFEEINSEVIDQYINTVRSLAYSIREDKK